LTYRKQQSNRINLIKMKNSSKFVKAFQVFKKEMTSNWVTVLILKSEFNDEKLNQKIQWYSSLGYEIKSI
jgi:hypothetical protein